MQVADLAASNSDLEDMNTLLEADSLRAQSERDELRTQMDSLLSERGEAATLRKQKQELQNQLDSLLSDEGEVATLKKQKQDLKRQLQVYIT